MALASAAHHRQDTAVLDPGVIDSLTTIMSASAVRLLLIDMARDVSERLDRLEEIQVATGSLDLIARDAHDLKSMGGNFGLTGLAAFAGTVERAARDESLDSVRTSVPQLVSLGRRSLSILRQRPEFIKGRAS